MLVCWLPHVAWCCISCSTLAPTSARNSHAPPAISGAAGEAVAYTQGLLWWVGQMWRFFNSVSAYYYYFLPHIDWTQNTIAGWSLSSHQDCLWSASPMGPVLHQITHLSPMPSIYHDLANIFHKSLDPSPSSLCIDCKVCPSQNRRSWRSTSQTPWPLVLSILISALCSAILRTLLQSCLSVKPVTVDAHLCPGICPVFLKEDLCIWIGEGSLFYYRV